MYVYTADVMASESMRAAVPDAHRDFGCTKPLGSSATMSQADWTGEE
jgi:hypothetical protein